MEKILKNGKELDFPKVRLVPRELVQAASHHHLLRHTGGGVDDAASKMAGVTGAWDDGLPERVSLPVENEQGKMETKVPEVRWRGVGKPRRAWCMGRKRDFEDGGGLCSPGRWTPSQRRVPQHDMGPLIYKLKLVYAGALEVKNLDPVKFTLKLALGQLEKNPFDEKYLVLARDDIKGHLILEDSECQVAKGQNHFLGILSMVMKGFGDPDWEFFGEIAEGANLGVDEPLPRTPQVCEEKVKRKLEEWEAEDDRDISLDEGLRGAD